MNDGATHRIKAAARWIGGAATVAACGFVIYGLYQTRALSAIDWRITTTWQTLAAAALAYAGAQVFQVMAWRKLLNDASSRPLTLRQSIHVYSVSAIYKYLPSNVLHHVGRYAMLRARGVEQFAIVWAAGFETLLMIAVATLLTIVFGWPLLEVGLASLPPGWATWRNFAIVASIGALTCAGGIWLLRARVLSMLRSLDPGRIAGGFGMACVGYAIFFALTGGIAMVLLGVIATPAKQVSIFELIAVMSCAWVLGFVTPGASAGVGVRETVIAVTLGSLTSLETGLALGVAYRIVTLSGDLLFALLGLALADRPPR